MLKSFYVCDFNFPFKTFLSLPTFSSSSDQDETRVHQCSFNKTYLCIYNLKTYYVHRFLYIIKSKNTIYLAPHIGVGLGKLCSDIVASPLCSKPSWLK